MIYRKDGVRRLRKGKTCSAAIGKGRSRLCGAPAIAENRWGEFCVSHLRGERNRTRRCAHYHERCAREYHADADKMTKILNEEARR